MQFRTLNPLESLALRLRVEYIELGWKRLKKDIAFAEVNQICAKHQIEIKDLESTTGSFDKRIFFINQKLLLRVSEAPMTMEQEKFKRVAALNFVPKILHTGMLENGTEPIFYTILTLLPGDDFVNAYRETTLAGPIMTSDCIYRQFLTFQAPGDLDIKDTGKSSSKHPQNYT